MLTLIATFNTMDAAKVHGVVKGEALKRGWMVNDESPRVIQSQDEQMEFSLDLKRQQIGQMICPGEDCDTHRCLRFPKRSLAIPWRQSGRAGRRRVVLRGLGR